MDRWSYKVRLSPIDIFELCPLHLTREGSSSLAFSSLSRWAFGPMFDRGIAKAQQYVRTRGLDYFGAAVQQSIRTLLSIMYQRTR